MVIAHDKLMRLARDHKGSISLNPRALREELKKMDSEFNKTAPFIRDRAAFNARTYTLKCSGARSFY